MRGAWVVVIALSACGSGEVTGDPDADAPEPATLPRADVEEVEDDVAWMRTDAGAPDVPAAQVDAVTATDVSRAPMDLGVAPPADVPTQPDVPTPPTDTGPPPLPELRCALRAADFDAPMQELDVPPTSTSRLRFVVADVPAGVTAATLRYDIFDADHPGEEGRISVNGAGAIQIPSNVAWDNVLRSDESVDVTALVRPGSNTVEFGPGPLDRSFFRVGRVRLEVVARAARCGAGPVAPPDAGAPTGPRVLRRVTYANARYTNRGNFVFRCDANYAYTARGDHAAEDCTGGYNPDGTLRGTATFSFPAVVSGTYDVVVTSRHSANRNSLGALFRVNGEAGRIDQRTGPGSLTLVDDVWGRRALGGDVTVVLDSTSNRGSDSVSAVSLRPVP